jgi:hypothetical protein
MGKIIISIYIILSFIVGLSTFKDYGVSWDEPMQRATAQHNFNYLFNQDNRLESWTDKDYGIAFELPIYILEKIFGWKKSSDNQQNVYFYRHLSTYVFFIFGGVCLFLLVSQLFSSMTLGVLALFLYLFNPRIYAHAYINSKDIPLMVMFIVCFYALYRFLKARTILNAVIVGFCAAFLINIRILGIIFPPMALTYILFIDVVDGGLHKVKTSYKNYIVFSLSTLLFTYILWPILWKNPIGNFIQFFENMSHFRHDSYELVSGEYIKASQDKTYFFKWFFATNPIGYLIGGIVGFSLILWQVLKKKAAFFSDEKLRFIAFLSLFFYVPLAIIILRNSVLYNGWRQLYFVYPGFIVLIIFAVSLLENIKYGTILTYICMLYCVYIGVEQLELHPYENVYFNEVVSKENNSLAKRYDIDYWGHSHKEALEYLTKMDCSDTIYVAFSELVGYRNIKILNKEDGIRVFYTENLKEADYFISNVYSDTLKFKEEKLIFEVRRYDNPVISIYKVN